MYNSFAFLDTIYTAYLRDPDLEHLVLDPVIQNMLEEGLDAARTVTAQAVTSGFPVPVMATTLNYYLSLASSRLPTNLIQAQRDFFGAHTYELTGKEGVFHTEWPEID